MFSESDIDKDGLLDRDEFVAYAAAQSQAGDKLFGGLLYQVILTINLMPMIIMPMGF